MGKDKLPADAAIPDALIATACARLVADKIVRRSLPGQGRLHIDRQLPFLCIFRHPADKLDLSTARLVRGEAAYLVASGSEQQHASLSKLVRNIVQILSAQFGAFLIVELWAGPDGGQANNPAVPTVSPCFEIVANRSRAVARTVEVLAQRLAQIKVLKQGVAVEVTRVQQPHPPEMSPLLNAEEARLLHCSTIGLIVPPVYRDLEKGVEFPVVHRSLARGIEQALKPTLYQFVRAQTTHRPPHYHELGRRAFTQAVWEVDRQLSEVSNAFDFLLQVSPIDSREAWNEFQRADFSCAPTFHYRPLPFDPDQLKRKLYEVPINRVEDPALQLLFRDKQYELDRKITMLRERETPQFYYGSLQLYGRVDQNLWQLATEILARVPARRGNDLPIDEYDAREIAARADAEIDYYRQLAPDFSAKVQITDKVTGVMVSRGILLLNPRTIVSPSRLEGLLQHEVGTHLLTYFNGKAQPLRQMFSGLAGYDELQEGLAVLAEYLVGSLNHSRLRQLASRVVAARLLSDGATFVETFQALHDTHGFSQEGSYVTTMRIYRGGGLMKDAVYLRGFRDILTYVAQGGSLDPLFLGKFAARHIPLVEELRYRQMLVAPPLHPRYMSDPEALRRLDGLRTHKPSVLELISSSLESSEDETIP